jgi:hypothetical protein
MAEQVNNNAGVQTPGAPQQSNNANANTQQQPVVGQVTVTSNNGQQQGAPAGMAINLDPTMLAALLGNPQVQANLANGQTVQVGNQLQQQAMMNQLQTQGVVPPQAPQIPGTAAPAQNPQQPAEKPGILARMKNGMIQFIINHPGWTIIITVAATVLVTLGCVLLYNKYFKTTATAVADNQKRFNDQKDMIAKENNALANRDNYQKVNLGSQTSVAKGLCMGCLY